MQAIAHYLPLRTTAVREAARHRGLWHARLVKVGGVLANLFCTVSFGMLLVWVCRQLWLELLA